MNRYGWNNLKVAISEKVSMECGFNSMKVFFFWYNVMHVSIQYIGLTSINKFGLYTGPSIHWKDLDRSLWSMDYLLQLNWPWSTTWKLYTVFLQKIRYLFVTNIWFRAFQLTFAPELEVFLLYESFFFRVNIRFGSVNLHSVLQKAVFKRMYVYHSFNASQNRALSYENCFSALFLLKKRMDFATEFFMSYRIEFPRTYVLSTSWITGTRYEEEAHGWSNRFLQTFYTCITRTNKASYCSFANILWIVTLQSCKQCTSIWWNSVPPALNLILWTNRVKGYSAIQQYAPNSNEQLDNVLNKRYRIQVRLQKSHLLLVSSSFQKSRNCFNKFKI